MTLSLALSTSPSLELHFLLLCCYLPLIVHGQVAFAEFELYYEEAPPYRHPHQQHYLLLL